MPRLISPLFAASLFHHCLLVPASASAENAENAEAEQVDFRTVRDEIRWEDERWVSKCDGKGVRLAYAVRGEKENYGTFYYLYASSYDVENPVHKITFTLRGNKKRYGKDGVSTVFTFPKSLKTAVKKRSNSNTKILTEEELLTEEEEEEEEEIRRRLELIAKEEEEEVYEENYFTFKKLGGARMKEQKVVSKNVVFGERGGDAVSISGTRRRYRRSAHAWSSTYYQGTKEVEFIVGPFTKKTTPKSVTTRSNRKLHATNESDDDDVRLIFRAFDDLQLSISPLASRGSKLMPKCELQELQSDLGNHHRAVRNPSVLAMHAVRYTKDASDKKVLNRHGYEKIKLLTYNTWGIAAPEWMERRVSSMDNERHRRFILISKYVKSEDPHIIVFTEVFLPWQVDMLRELLPDHCRYAAQSPTTFGYYFTGGILICSQFPIHEQEWVSFGNPQFGWTKFTYNFYEKFANKGVLHAQVQIPWSDSGFGDEFTYKYFDVFGAHTQSSNDRPYDEYGAVREEQFRVIREFMDRVKAKGEKAQGASGGAEEHVALLMGDLNVDALAGFRECWAVGRGELNSETEDTSYNEYEENEYHNMLRIVDLDDYAHDGTSRRCNISWSRRNKWHPDLASEYLDYILITKESEWPDFLRHFYAELSVGNPVAVRKIKDKGIHNISDHLPVILELSQVGYVAETTKGIYT